MSETVLINAATVAAGDPCDVVAFHITAGTALDFRIVCDNAYSVTFYVADADFTDVADAADLDGYGGAHAATTGTVYQIEAGSYDYVAAVVTNSGGDAATVTVAAGYDLVAAPASALFTVAEARAFDKLQLSDDTVFTDATIIAKEAEIREWLEQVMGVNLIPTTHTDEVLSGDGTHDILTKWPRVTAVTAASIRSGTTWTALTADELALVFIDTDGICTLYRDGSYWPSGKNNVKVTYTAGFATVPELVKRAALMIAANEIPAGPAPWTATGYDAGDVSYTFTRGDGYNGNWHAIPDVMKAIRLYSHKPPAVA